MNTIRFFLLLSLWLPLRGNAQTTPTTFLAKHTVFAELAGKGAVYSLNYDRIIRQAGLTWSVRAGTMYLPSTNITGASLFVPLAINAFTGKRNHHLEFSFGQTLRYFTGYTVEGQLVKGKLDYPLTFAGVGYRYQKPGGGLFASVTALPSFRPFRGVDGLRVDFLPWLGLGLGRSF
ncbi:MULTISPECIES: hypothetical protein [unclassified Spirosoma]|uniref:hypothetical protein n=1 Tax=unclassified Spirosoma TaxID=2621999 RepID=UPI00095BCACC|nr:MULTISPECIES: hypothetical protein [unclassified Spirosoma]MBN8826534.1 hypothetical protein [Spirosoma sp.]OJW71611.1 MAG: hypothetical protein BGO59_26935 [Spirosoma sp. 48-14]